MQEIMKIEIAFFHPVGNPNICMLDNFFYALNTPTNRYLYRLVVEIFLKLSTKTTEVHLDDFSSLCYQHSFQNFWHS